MNKLILLSGTPASGKDTVTDCIVAMDSSFCYFKKHKGGEGGKIDDSYYMVDLKKFDEMVAANEFVQYHYRYGRGYGVAHSTLQEYWDRGLTPIIHVGQYKNIHPFYQLKQVQIYSILLLTDYPTTKSRLLNRHATRNDNVDERLLAYQQERQELAELLMQGEPLNFDWIINNSHIKPEQVATEIMTLCQQERS